MNGAQMERTATLVPSPASTIRDSQVDELTEKQKLKPPPRQLPVIKIRMNVNENEMNLYLCIFIGMFVHKSFYIYIYIQGVSSIWRGIFNKKCLEVNFL